MYKERTQSEGMQSHNEMLRVARRPPPIPMTCEQKVGEKRTSRLYIGSNSNLGGQMVSEANSQQNGTEAVSNQVVSTSLQVGSGGRFRFRLHKALLQPQMGNKESDVESYWTLEVRELL